MRLNIGRVGSVKFKSIVMYTVSFLMVLGSVGFAAPRFFGQVAHAVTPTIVEAAQNDPTDTTGVIVDTPVPTDIVIPTPTPVDNLSPPTDSSLINPEPSATLTTSSKWTFEKVELNKEYIAPQNSGVKLTFTKLPSPAGNIKIEEITLTQEQIKQTGSLSDKAYDITSDMTDGSFSYNLSLPIPETSKGKAIDVKFSEDLSKIGSAAKVENTLTKTDTSVSVNSLDHFTIFIVYSQAGNLWGAYASQNDSTYGNFGTQYDNFTLGSGASITSVQWTGAYFYGPPDPNFLGSADPGTISGFTIKFYSDVIDSSGGSLNGLHRPNIEAGPIYTTAISGNAGEHDLGYKDIYVASGAGFTGIGPNEMYSYGTNLATPFSATAGTQYWLSIVADSTYPPEWGWETAGVVAAGLSYHNAYGGTLVPNISGGDFAFSLSSDFVLTLTSPAATTITRSALVPETSGVPTAGNAAVDTAVVGLSPIAVTLANTGAGPSTNVRISPIGAGSNIQLWAKDTSNNWFDINVTGWIGSAGKSILAGSSITTDVYAISDVAGSYPLTVNLVYVAGGTAATSSGTVTVNVPAPTLTVNKVCNPAGDLGKFNLRIDGVNITTDSICGGTSGPVVVSASSHTVGETAGSGTTLSRYNSVISGDCAADGTVTLVAGDNKTCTITNTLDTTPPTMTVTMDDAALNIGDTSLVTFTFSEVPVGFTTADVTVDNGLIGTIDTSNPLIQTATFTPTNSITDATNIITVGTGWTDAALNTGAGDDSPNYTIDTLAPSAFATGAVNTTSVQSPGIASYWNGTDIGVHILVPFANDTSLTGGTMQLQANVGGGYISFGPAYEIFPYYLNFSRLFVLSAGSLEGIAGFSEGVSVNFRAIITDNAGNATIGTQSVTTLTVDQTAPVITRLGTSPVDVGHGSVYTDAGATALDNGVVNLTSSIVTVNPVNTSVVGLYTVTYNVSDAAGNPATQVTRTVNVTQVAQIISVVTPAPATADYGSTFSVAATSDSSLVVAVSTSGVCTNIGNVVTMTSGIGTCTVHYNQAGNTNYSIATEVTSSTGATLRPLSISANNNSKTYGTTKTYGLAEIASVGLVVGDSITGTTLTSAGDIATAPVGNYPITPSGATGVGLSNYDITYFPAGTLTVNKADQTISFGAFEGTYTYGDTPFSLTVTATSELPVSFNSETDSVCTVTGSIVSIVGAGTCTIYASQVGNTNYNAAPDVTQGFTVQPKAITVTADDQSKVLGTADPISLAYQITSGELVGTDAFTGSIGRIAGESVGSYAINNQGTLTLGGNYDLSFVAGTFTIVNTTPPTLTANPPAAIKTSNSSGTTPTTAPINTPVWTEVATTDTTADVQGTATKNADKKGEVQGTSDTKKKDTSNWTDAQFLGLAWYWWILILAAAGGAAWWFLAGSRRRAE